MALRVQKPLVVTKIEFSSTKDAAERLRKALELLLRDPNYAGEASEAYGVQTSRSKGKRERGVSEDKL